MELKANSVERQLAFGRKVVARSHSESVREARSNPRSRELNRSARADAYVAFAGEVLRELNPRGPLESVMAGHVASAAWKLKQAVDRLDTRIHSEIESNEEPKKVTASTIDRAARSVKEALSSLEIVREIKTHRVEIASSKPFCPISDPDFELNEWPVVPFPFTDDLSADKPTIAKPTPVWRDRLVFDFEISDHSPVVSGTWITVSHVVSLIVDGQTWADILRSHPELSEDDLRVCVAYAVAQDQDES